MPTTAARPLPGAWFQYPMLFFQIRDGFEPAMAWVDIQYRKSFKEHCDVAVRPLCPPLPDSVNIVRSIVLPVADSRSFCGWVKRKNPELVSRIYQRGFK
jgi:hypothetical protein